MPRFAPFRMFLDLGLDEPEKPSASTPRKSFLFTLLSTLGAALLLTGCKEEIAVVKPAPVVRIMSVRLVPDVERRSYSGVIRARFETEEAFRVGGRLAERKVDVGDRVTAGQILATLDPQDLALSFESAEAELRAAQSGLAQTSAEEGRARDLSRRGYASQSDFERRQLAALEARARLDRAERALALARNQRAYAVLASSGEGVVTAVHAEGGQVMAQGQRVVSIARLSEREVVAALPESRLADLEGSRPEISLWAGGRVYQAKLREVSPQADSATRTYGVRFSLPEADDAMRLGMTAMLTLVRGSERPVAKLPASAVLNQGTGPSVFTVDPQTLSLKLVPVRVARFGDGEVVIESGLKDGDRVVTLGVQKLDEGLRVRLADAR